MEPLPVVTLTGISTRLLLHMQARLTLGIGGCRVSGCVHPAGLAALKLIPDLVSGGTEREVSRASRWDGGDGGMAPVMSVR